MWSNQGYAEQPIPAGSTGPAVHTATGPTAAQHAPATPAALVPTQHTAGAAAGPLAPLVTADRASDIPVSLGERIELCRFLSEANLLPRALQQAPANVLLIMHKAMALEIPLSVAIEHLYVIDGKVGHSAELLRALLYRHGHILRWINKSANEAQGELVLAHDPKHPRVEKFTIADATRMELTGKTNWKKDPESMMIARCTTRLVSRHCPEIGVALGNLSAMDIDDEERGEPVQATAETGPSKEAAAQELFVESQYAETREELKLIGTRARQDGLLEVKVDHGDGTLQEALLQRLAEIGQATATPEAPEPERKPGKTKVAEG